jgi:hypothetical protein
MAKKKEVILGSGVELCPAIMSGQIGGEKGGFRKDETVINDAKDRKHHREGLVAAAKSRVVAKAFWGAKVKKKKKK